MSTLTILWFYFHRIAMLIRSSRVPMTVHDCVHTGLPDNRMQCWYGLMTTFDISNECLPPTFREGAADTIVKLIAITVLIRCLGNWWHYFKPAYSQVLDWNLEEGQKHYYHEQWPNHNEHLYSPQTIDRCIFSVMCNPAYFLNSYTINYVLFILQSVVLQYEARIDNFWKLERVCLS